MRLSPRSRNEFLSLLVGFRLLFCRSHVLRMRFLQKQFWPWRPMNADIVPHLPSSTTTSTIQFNETIGNVTQERNKQSDETVDSIESFPGITLTNRTIQEQIADKNEAAVGALALDPSTVPDASNDKSDINAIKPVTLQAEKSMLKHKLLKQNAKRKSKILESRLPLSENEDTLNSVLPRFHRRQPRLCSKSENHIMSRGQFQTL